MAPPRRAPEDGQVVFHTAFTPLSTPLAFVSPAVACCAVGNSICLWNTEDSSTEYIHTTVLSITKLAGDPLNGLLAFCEGGTSPQIFVYATRPAPKLLYTLPGVTELELADLAFSRCGSRLYALSRASGRRLSAFSADKGTKLNGCELELPLRFDKISVYPGHKDYVALIRSSGVRLVTISKSFETYITRLHASAIPSDNDLSISAYAWTVNCHFLFATRQGALCTLDGRSGQVLHVCQVQHPITSIAVMPEYIMTTHIGNTLQFWRHDQNKPLQSNNNLFASMPEMGSKADGGVFSLLRTADLDSVPQVELRLFGQVAYLQVNPDCEGALLATAEGEVWAFRLPQELVEDPEETKLQVETLQLRLLTWFHTHPVSDVAMLGASPRVCASTDEGGRLRLWRLGPRTSDDKGLRVVCFTSALTSLSPDEDGQLLLVGSDSGCVHVVNAVDWRKPDVLDTLRISEAGVAKICSVTHEGRCMSAAAALFDNRIAFFTVMFTDPKVHMFGFVDIMGTVDDMCFHTRDFKRESVASARLLVVGASHEGRLPCLWAIRAPPLDYDPNSAELTRDICPVWSLKLGADQKIADKPSAVTSVTKKAAAIGFAGGDVRFYALPSSSGPTPSKQSVATPAESLMPHDQYVSCLHTSRDGAWLISASMDGYIRRVPVEGAKKVELQKVLHNPYNGGVVQVCTSHDNLLLISTGGLDGILAWSRSDAELGALGSLHDDYEDADEDRDEEEEDHALVLEVDDKDVIAFPVWYPISSKDRALQAQAEADDPELNAVALAQRKALGAEIEGLRKKLKVLVDQNSSCPELEQLDRKEFCVDFEERDTIFDKTKERCDALRAQIERENLARQLIRDRLIKEFWDPMRTKGCQICSLMSKFCVSNYPERIVSEEEQGTIRKLRNLRRMEQLEQGLLKESAFPSSLRDDQILKVEPFTTGKESYIVNWWSSQLPPAEASRALLYQPFQLLSNSRRRLQIYLLQSLSAEFRTAFNQLFTKCQGDKQQIMEQIRERTARIRAILVELQIDEPVPEPELQDIEDAEHVLKVADSEIVAEKWISEEERKRLAEAAAREEERLRALRENDAGTRALQQMMGGTLRTKKDLSALEITLDKEPWMDQIPEEEMSDLQRQLLKEFQEKERALLEEQDKYRKQLDGDLKRLRGEVQELMQQFENILKELSHQRFAHDAKFFCQELYCVRLQLALLQSVEDEHVLRQSAVNVGKAQSKLLSAEEGLDAFRSRVAVAREKQDERVRHEKEVSSATHFRQQFAQSGLEPETITALLQLFRRRHAPRQQSVLDSSEMDRRGILDQSMSASGWTLQPRDPYPDLGTAGGQEAEAFPEEEQFSEECPDGVDEASFDRMLELRHERLIAEQEVMRGQKVLQEMGGLLAHLQQERDDRKGEHDQSQGELAEHEQLMDRELHDVEILFQLRQGQVEVPQAAVVTDYSDAIVIDQEVVETRNRRIIELGKDKTGTLGTIKEFRKRLNLLQWEHKMIALQTSDLEERTKDVHMLRVTKGLQSLLKGGEESRNKADADLLERKIEHLNATTQQKEATMRKQHAMGGHAIKLRKGENAMLEKKLRELQQNVIQREHIRRLRAPQGSGAGGAGGREGERPRIIGGGGRIEENEAAIRAAQATFRETRTRQGLLDAARKHTDEIEVLRKELDRLRQRTFPSFVQLHEERPANPDQARY